MIDRDKYLPSESLFRAVHNLTDTDLENHIKDLIAMAYDYEIVFGRNSTTPLFLLLMAAIEKNYRTSSTLSRTAIYIASFSSLSLILALWVQWS